MECRELGRLQVPVIGLGTARTFDVTSAQDIAVRRQVIDACLAHQVTFVDSSPMYGQSERVIGLTTEGRREHLQVATKVWCQGRARGEEQIRQSLQLCKTDYIDVLQIHNLVDWQTHLVTLERLRDQGTIGLIGITHYSTSAYPLMIEIMRSGRVDTIQIPYNVLERTCEASILPLAAERGIGVIVMEPLDKGRFVRGLRRQPDLAPLMPYGISTWGQALLAWVLGDPRISVAIPATSRPERIAENAAAGAIPALPHELRDYIGREARRCLAQGRGGGGEREVFYNGRGACRMSWTLQLLSKPYGGVTEGPVWDGEFLYFTHIPTSRIMRYDPRSGAIIVWREGTNRTNGLAHDLQGRLFGCCSGGRAIVRFDPDGRILTIADRLDGKKLNTPNDLAIDRQGRIWFTNPWNEGNIDATETEELDNRSVLRADPQPSGDYTVTRVTFDTTMPNGILVSPDQRTLYVAESGYAADRPRELRAYRIRDDGSLGPYTTLHTFGSDPQTLHRGIDGMCFDAEGNIVATAGWEQGGPGPMLYVFSPMGRVLETHPVPALRPTNCCFGGPDMTTLYVTSTQGHFFRMETDRVGWAMYP